MWANSTETTDTASKKCEMWNAIRSLSTFQSVIQSGLRVPMLLLLSILYGPLHWESHCAELATINLDSTECQLNHWKQISLTIKLETENQLSPNRTWSTGAYPQLTVQRSLLENIWNVDSSDRGRHSPAPVERTSSGNYGWNRPNKANLDATVGWIKRTEYNIT